MDDGRANNKKSEEMMAKEELKMQHRQPLRIAGTNSTALYVEDSKYSCLEFYKLKK
jgi:hypothetical protein